MDRHGEVAETGRGVERETSRRPRQRGAHKKADRDRDETETARGREREGRRQG